MVRTRMRYGLIFLLGMVFAPAISWAQKQATLTVADSAAIKQVITGFTDSYNHHDPHDLAKWFTANGEFTTAEGDISQGRKEIEEHHAPLFVERLKDVHREVSVKSMRLLTPDVASVYIYYEVTGSRSASGSPIPARKGLYYLILTRQGGRWLIDVFHGFALPSSSARPST
jgi:uncharacterized protein (TIGR02246 family)